MLMSISVRSKFETWRRRWTLALSTMRQSTSGWSWRRVMLNGALEGMSPVSRV